MSKIIFILLTYTLCYPICFAGPWEDAKKLYGIKPELESKKELWDVKGYGDGPSWQVYGVDHLLGFADISPVDDAQLASLIQQKKLSLGGRTQEFASFLKAEITSLLNERKIIMHVGPGTTVAALIPHNEDMDHIDKNALSEAADALYKAEQYLLAEELLKLHIIAGQYDEERELLPALKEFLDGIKRRLQFLQLKTPRFDDRAIELKLRCARAFQNTRTTQ